MGLEIGSNVVYTVRPVVEADKELLLQWANEKDVRKNAFTQEKITKEQHDKWFVESMNSRNNLMFVMMMNNVPVGQCRLSVSDHGAADIDYSIDKDYRGQGLGKILLDLVIREVKEKQKNINRLIGRVKCDNYPSVRSFENAGFFEKFRTFEIEL